MIGDGIFQAWPSNDHTAQHALDISFSVPWPVEALLAVEGSSGRLNTIETLYYTPP